MKHEQEKSLEEQLKEEASQLYNLAKDYRRERYMSNEEKEAFVLNKLWYKKWKEYVSYADIKKSLLHSYYYNHYKTNKYEPKIDSHPGPINNNYVLVPLNEFLNDGDPSNPENTVVRHDIDQKQEIKLVNKLIWEFFYNKYGGGPEILKKSIAEKSKYSTIPKKIIELYYRKFNIVVLPKRTKLIELAASNEDFISEPHIIYISRIKTLNDLKEKISIVGKDLEVYKDEPLNPLTLKLWKLNTNVSLDQFKNNLLEQCKKVEDGKTLLNDDLVYLEYFPNSSLEEIELADTDICILEHCTPTSPYLFEIKKIETREGKCEWCGNRKMLRFFCICKDVWYCTESCLDKDKNIHNSNCKKKFEVEENTIKESERSRKGLVGLQNLGNTCFMNTSLQCISNCYEITQYFLKDYYKKDINVDNPIGTGGVLAKGYANFLKNVWYGESSVFSPWNFKKAISTFQSMFSGYQQHDTQEFLNYLLDGLHEDLNRVLKKPMVEKDDGKKDDQIKSKEQWVGFLRRNQSTLVDILYGQYKSTLYCPDTECQNVSTTFDPFLSVSLPLVAKTETYEVVCYFIFYEIKHKPLQLSLPFSVETTIMALRNKVAKILNVHPFSFFVVKMDQSGNYDHILHSSALLKVNNYYQSNNQKPFFLFQIEPSLFYSKYNKYCLNNQLYMSLNRDFSDITTELENRYEENKKLFSDDYEEDESGTTSESTCYYSKIYYNSLMGKQAHTIKVNVDDNYGFDDNFVKVVIYLKKYEDNYRRSRVIFPRILYLNKNWTCVEVHHHVFKYFSELVKTQKSLPDTTTDQELWSKVFINLNTENKNDNLEYSKKAEWPYRLRLKNIFSQRVGNCCYCDESNCDDCLLPYDDKITIKDLIEKLPKNEGAEIDNTFFFLNDKQKHYAGGNFNRDFQLEVSWLPEYSNTVYQLNDKRDHDFKIMKSQKNKQVSILDCFKNFVKLEKLEENNEWYCSQCKKHQRATKKMEIYKSPHILIVHLKRFRNNSKIDTVVDFPINGLDISHYVINNEKDQGELYDLFAIANHYGNMGFGHYTAFGKNPLDNQWYEFDDSHVSKKSENDLINSSAYVLFYRRRGLEQTINLDEIYTKSFINYENFQIVNSTNESMDVNMNNITIDSRTTQNATIIQDYQMRDGIEEERKSKESS